MRAGVLFIFFLLLCCTSIARQVRVGLLVKYNAESYTVIAGKGEYGVYNGHQRVAKLTPGQSLNVELYKGQILLKRNGHQLGRYSRLNFKSLTQDGFFRLKANESGKDAMPYQDHLEFIMYNGNIRPVNVIDLEKYVASVIESETGSVSAPEFLKVQAIIARTYALGHLNRHAPAGFNVCDDVHCQAYKSKSRFNPHIKAAVDETRDLVLMDRKNQLITAAYHSNCGGQTISALDVWSTNLTYLQPVNDTFCLAGQHTDWIKIIPKDDWISYLNKNSINFSEEKIRDSSYSFVQENRTCCYVFKDLNLPLKNIRSEFKLKSTFFNWTSVGDSLELRGKGFGHGVGLCQEGAIQMAALGHTYKSIISFYFNDVKIVNSIKKLPIQD